MLQITVSRRHLMVFVAVVAMVVSVAWVGVASRASAASATPVAYVTTGENFPDALGAGPVAGIVRGPILLVSRDAIPGATAAELSRLTPDKIVIVGGTAVVSASVETGLKAYAATVERIAGANRYETAAQLSAATFPAKNDADTLDGKDSSAFMTRAVYDTDTDGVVDTTEIKIRYTDDSFRVDLGATLPGMVRCVTDPVTFDGQTTVVASGGLSLEPFGPDTTSIYGVVHYTTDGGANWVELDGVGVEDSPAGMGETAAVPVDAAGNLGAGRYRFAILPFGADFMGGDDYHGYCELTVTAYTGQGASADFVATSTGEEAHTD